MDILPVTDDRGVLLEPQWLARAEPVHRQLRDKLPADYRGRLTEIFATGGRLVLTVEGDRVLGLALWRVVDNTYEGRRLYVDDLVTDAACRSRGVGHGLLAWLEMTAGRLGCAVLALDSGVQRGDAHRFYFREGFFIPSFSFRKKLT